MSFIRNKILFTIISFIILSSIFLYDNSRTVTSFNQSEVIRSGNNDKYIAFTCNVDWGTEYIKPMLDILKEKDIVITFFVSGRWAKNNPEILKEIYSYGHEIGNHGYGHRMHSKISFEENYKEIYDTHNIIKDILGIEMNYFAPPAGDFDEETLEVAHQLGYKTILWSIDTIDWRKDTTYDKIINRVMNKPLESSIVLMHPKEVTLKALPNLIEQIQSKGVNIGTVTDVLTE